MSGFSCSIRALEPFIGTYIPKNTVYSGLRHPRFYTQTVAQSFYANRRLETPPISTDLPPVKNLQPKDDDSSRKFHKGLNQFQDGDGKQHYGLIKTKKNYEHMEQPFTFAKRPVHGHVKNGDSLQLQQGVLSSATNLTKGPRKMHSISNSKTPILRWQAQKKGLEDKLNGQKWAPRKRLSPDALDGIRALHARSPEKFTTPVLAAQFKVSPDAIRRILKSKWRPTDIENEDRVNRWIRRGERIWSNLVELGVKPPKKWREMGIGKAKPGQLPNWKKSPAGYVRISERANDPYVLLEEQDSISTSSPSHRFINERSLADRIL